MDPSWTERGYLERLIVDYQEEAREHFEGVWPYGRDSSQEASAMCARVARALLLDLIASPPLPPRSQKAPGGA
jgi:hypothetical protein